ncbi:MAG: hypothetical protein ACK2U5_01865 [Candidatus Promineifilaceae bacterium]
MDDAKKSLENLQSVIEEYEVDETLDGVRQPCTEQIVSTGQRTGNGYIKNRLVVAGRL